MAGQLAIRRPAAGATPSTGGAGGSEIRLDDIRIADGTLIYRDAKSGSEQKVESLNVEHGATSLHGPFRAGGNLSFQGVPVMFKLDTGALDAAAPAQIAAEIGLAKTDTTFKFTGTVASAPELAVKGRLDLSTHNLALTLDSLAPGTSGGLPIAVDKPFQIAGDVGYAGGGGEIQNLTVALDDTTASGSAKFTPGTPAKAEATLGLNRLDLYKLLASMATTAAGNAAPAGNPAAGGFSPPQDIDASLAIAVGAISYRGGGSTMPVWWPSWPRGRWCSTNSRRCCPAAPASPLPGRWRPPTERPSSPARSRPSPTICGACWSGCIFRCRRCRRTGCAPWP
jgi:hypothetical protein